MSVKYHQISLKETFADCQDSFFDDTPSFFQILKEHFDISEFIPFVFYNAFYQSPGRKQQDSFQTLSFKRSFPSYYCLYHKVP